MQITKHIRKYLCVFSLICFNLLCVGQEEKSVDLTQVYLRENCLQETLNKIALLVKKTNATFKVEEHYDLKDNTRQIIVKDCEWIDVYFNATRNAYIVDSTFFLIMSPNLINIDELDTQKITIHFMHDIDRFEFDGNSEYIFSIIDNKVHLTHISKGSHIFDRQSWNKCIEQSECIVKEYNIDIIE